MKTPIFCTLLFLCTFINAFPSNAKVFTPKISIKPPIGSFGFLRGHKAGKGYSLQWSMSSNTGIQSFQVQSTYEDPSDPYSNWLVKGNVSNNGLNIFKFTDENILPGVINYRVIAILSGNAGNIVSDIYTAVIK